MPNVAEHFKLRTGNVDQGFKESDWCLKRIFRNQLSSTRRWSRIPAHAQFDKESGASDHLVANDAPFRALHEITEALAMSKEKSGSSSAAGRRLRLQRRLKVEPIAVALAFHTNGRPVR